MKENSLASVDASWLLESIWLTWKGHVFCIGKPWENMFLTHGSISALFISIPLIVSQQGQQEIFSLKASVFHWSFLRNIYSCSIKIRIAEYESLEEYIIITCPLHQLKVIEVCDVSYAYLGVFERTGSCSWADVLSCETGLMVVFSDGRGLNLL